MPTADELVARYKAAPQPAAPPPKASADDLVAKYKFTRATPAPAPKPAAPAAPKPENLVQRAKRVYGEMGRNYIEDVGQRYRAGVEQASQGPQSGFDLAGAVMRPLNIAGGALEAGLAPITGAIDTLAGRPLARATANAPSGKHYDLRIPKETLGSAAETAAGFMVGAPELKAGKVARPAAEIAEAAPAARVAAKADDLVERFKPGAAPVAAAKADDLVAKFKPGAKPDELAIPEPPKRARTLAAKADAAEPELVSPGPSGEGGPVVGGEADAVERVDNALYRLGGHATADKIEAQDFLKALPPEIADPKVQEELYNAIEAKLADPGATIPEGLRPAFEAFKPYYEEQTAIINRLRERNDPNIEPYLEDQGYVARRVQGQSPLFDRALDPSERSRDPIMGGKSLFRSTPAQKQRTAGFMATDAEGNTHFWRGEVPETDIKGRPYKNVRQATTAEIEANTPIRYHKNALINTVDNVLRLRRVERNLQVLDELTQNLKSEGLAWKSEWRYRDPESGRMMVQRANTEKPTDFVELPHVPQLRDMYFDKRVAEALKDYYPGPDEPLDNVLAKVNRALTGSLFITPVPHAANVMNHWIVGRGWDWMTPGGYKTLMQTGTKAVKEVLTMGPEYRRLMREGSGLLYGDTQTRDFYKLMLEKAGAEVVDDPKAANAFAKAAGIPVEWVRGLYDWSNKALWAANDVFMLQRQLELEAKGMSPRMAIREAERDIPNYRIPPQIMKSRPFAQFMKSPNTMMFGRYKYGQMRAWGTMFKDLMGKGTPEQQKEAVGKFLVTAIMSMGVYPIADAALRMATGNKDARVKRSGGFSLSDSLSQMATGQKELATGLSSFFSPAPAWSMASEIMSNHDFFGRPIRTEGAPGWFQAAQGAKYAAENAVYPVQLGLEAIKPGGAKSAAGKLVGVELPTEKQAANKKKYAAKRKAAGRKAAGRFVGRIKSGHPLEAIEKIGR